MSRGVHRQRPPPIPASVRCERLLPHVSTGASPWPTETLGGLGVLPHGWGVRDEGLISLSLSPDGASDLAHTRSPTQGRLGLPVCPTPGPTDT